MGSGFGGGITLGGEASGSERGTVVSGGAGWLWWGHWCGHYGSGLRMEVMVVMVVALMEVILKWVRSS